MIWYRILGAGMGAWYPPLFMAEEAKYEKKCFVFFFWAPLSSLTYHAAFKAEY